MADELELNWDLGEQPAARKPPQAQANRQQQQPARKQEQSAPQLANRGHLQQGKSAGSHQRDQGPQGARGGHRRPNTGGAAEPRSQGRPAPKAGRARGDAQRAKPGFADAIVERGADSDEDNEVAALVARVAQRDALLEAELQDAAPGGVRPAGHPNQDENGTVEFGYSSEEEGAGGKHRKGARREGNSDAAANGLPASSKGLGHPHSSTHRKRAQRDVDLGVDAKHLPARVTLAPGQLTHTDVGEAAVGLFADTNGRDNGATAGHNTNAAQPGSWAALGVNDKLCQHLASLNFERPTRVQTASIPPLLQHRDVLVRAATGSGKTLSYLVPIVQDLALQVPKISRADGTYAVIIAPTRELCLQIQDVAVQLLKRYIWLVSGIVIGGENRTHEKQRLRKGVTVLAATPGRLADHLHSTKSFNTRPLRWLVLDEADRLLDLGFEARLKEIVSLLDQRSALTHTGQGPGAARRTTALLSATLHSGLGALATMSLKEPVAVGFTVQQGQEGLQVLQGALPKLDCPAGQQGEGAGGSAKNSNGGVAGQSGGEQFELPAQLKQRYIEVEAKQRLVMLAGLLRQKLMGGKPRAMGVEGKRPGKAGDVSSPLDKRKAVVFLSSCDSVEFHHTLLAGRAWRQAAGGPLLGADVPLLKLHGDMPQAQRTAAFVTFSQADKAVLFCTDVAARGLDFPDVTFILQYDAPGAPTEYVHRVGRTARMGHAGEAVLFLMPHEKSYAPLLTSKGVAIQEVSCEGALMWLPSAAGAMDEGWSSGNRGGKANTGRPMALAFNLQRKLMQEVAQDPKLHSLAGDAFRSFVRAYATHPTDVKHIFHVRSLHLGHVAFAHGLKEVPTLLGSSASGKERKRKRAEEQAAKQKGARKKLHKAAAKVMDEEG